MENQIEWGTCEWCEKEVHADDLVDGSEYGYKNKICISCEADCLYADEHQEIEDEGERYRAVLGPWKVPIFSVASEVIYQLVVSMESNQVML